jgi:phytoene desaturase
MIRPMTSTTERYDALVIGAGAGGLAAAALLSHRGYRTLLVESRDRVGGRASSHTTDDGYTVNTGAIAIEYGGPLEQVFKTVGAPFEIRIPEPATLFRIKGRDISLGKGPLGAIVNGALKRGAGILQSDDNETSVKAWLSGYTKNETVHAIFRNLCAAIFAVNSDELPVRAFMTYFLQKGAFRNFGFSPTGTLGLMQGLADTVTEVWLSSEVGDLHVHENRVTGVTVHRAGETVEVEADVVVSNVGPHATTELAGREHFDGAYLARLDGELKPTANIVFNIASDVPLMDAPGIITFGITRRLCNMANLTATCPELAPPGKHLYVAYGVPIPAVGEFDEAAEIESTHQDLRDNFHGFDRNAQILSIKVMRGEWPAQRSIAGHDLPRETPLENLWNVGDGNREYADGGIQACAESGRLAVDEILKLHGEALTPR